MDVKAKPNDDLAKYKGSQGRIYGRQSTMLGCQSII